jgi:hypothetical protein
MAACLAFVGAVGFNALAINEHDYLAGLPTNPVPPSAPGAILHGTVVTLSSCPASFKLGSTPPISCTATVVDTYNNPANLKVLQGRIDWYYTAWSNPTTPIASCVLPATTTVGINSCPMSWWPVAPTFSPSTGTLSATYVPTSNHIGNSGGAQLQLLPNVDWTGTQCYDALSGVPAWQVEIGLPVRCQVHVQDLSTGAPTIPPTVTFSTINGSPPHPGVGMFTCSTTVATQTPPSPIWGGTAQPCQSPADPLNPPALKTNGQVSFGCTPDSTGMCEVLYRRLYENGTLAGVGDMTPLTLAAAGDTFQLATKILPESTPHPSLTYVVCTSTDKNVSANNGGGANFGNAQFNETQDLDIEGGVGTQLQCTATVVDAGPTGQASLSNNPAVTNNANPNLMEVYPPMGSVTLMYNGPDGTSPPVPLAPPCLLVRSDRAAFPPTAQAVGQAPFVSTCVMPPVSLTVSKYPGGEPALTVDYSGPTHAPSVSPRVVVKYQ